MKKILFLFVVFGFSQSVFATLPPEYLSVPKWKNCASVTVQGSAEYVCLPNARPYNCPPTSWEQLTRKQLMKPCSKNDPIL